MPPSKEDMMSKQYDTYQPGVSKRGNKLPNGITILSSQTLLFIVLLNLIIGASFFMAIRSEVNSSQIQQRLLNLSEQVQNLNDQIKQKQNITEFTQLKDWFEAQFALIEKPSFFVEKSSLIYDSIESKIALAIEAKNGYLNNKVEIMKEELSEMKIQAAKLTERSSFFIEKPILIEAIDVKYDALNSKVEIMKEELSQMKIKSATFADERELLENKTQVALAKQGIENIQKSLDPALIQIAQLSSINVEISNLKKESLDLQTSLNEHLKQASITSIKSGSNTSTTTTGADSSSSPQPASNSTSTDDSQYLTQIYGPYFSPLHGQSLSTSSTEFAIFDTTSPCILIIKQRAIVTLIANGSGVCNSCVGIISFLINGEIKLRLTNYNNYYSGAQNLHTLWDPISLTQEFVVEAGTHYFSLGFASINSGSSFTVTGLSFMAKVSYG